MITVTASAALQPGTSLENRAVAGSSMADSDASNNAATADTSVVGAADLTISEERQPGQRGRGRDCDVHDPHHQHRPRPGAQRGCERPAPGRLNLSLSLSLERRRLRRGGVPVRHAPGGRATRTITVVAQVNPDAPAGTVTNTAAVYATDEANQANNTATANTTITTAADVAVRKVALSDPVGPTAGLLYELQVSNAGPSDAQNVVVTDTLDANVTFVSASAGCVLTGAEVVCTAGTLGAGATAKYLVAVQVADVAGGTVLTNTVVATSDDQRPGQRQQHGDAYDDGAAS